MSNAPILVLGKGGQLSNALAGLLGSRAVVIGKEDVDFLHSDFITNLEQSTRGQSFGAVINTAAFTQVDACETAPGRQQALRINGAAVGELAAWCARHHLPLVHYSSDYVFDGSGSRPWREDDPPHPVNMYGQSKLSGERLLAERGGKHLLFRTSWLYDATGKNFFNTIRRLLSEKEILNVVADQFGAPTYVPHLARATLEALDRASSEPVFEGGVYHLCSSGETSWHGFAHAIYERERKRNPHLKCRGVYPIPTSQYPLPACRPLNSRLDCERARNTFGIAMPSWEDGLRECLAET